MGRSPSQRDMDALPDFPSRGAYRNHFGSVEKAKQIVGLPPCPKGIFNSAVYANYHRTSYKLYTFKKLTLGLRFKTLHRDNFTCQYCGQKPQDGIKLQVDHIIPQSKGGETNLNNLTTSCKDCNFGKRAMILNNHPKKIPQRVKNKRLSEVFNNNQISWLNT